MRAFLLLAGVAALAAGAACSRPKPPATKVETLTAVSEARAAAAGEPTRDERLIIGRGEDYQPIDAPVDRLFVEMRDSMLRRRQRAWEIVERVIRPATLAAGGGTLRLPVWQTWYENAPDVRLMMTAYFEKLKATPDADREQLVEEVFREYAERDLAERLTDEAFRQKLSQFEDSPELTAGLNGQGVTMFSPSFVKHVMLQAQGTELCPFTVPADTRPQDLPAPAGPQNFSSCITEFPRSAVMVKTNWRPVDTGLPDHDTGDEAMRRLIRSGTWPRTPPLVMPAANTFYTVTSDTGERMALTGIHFVTKDIREWVWVTLWWDPQPDTDFGSDRPAAIAQYDNGVWANYKMCVTSSFEDDDKAPWASFADPGMQASLRAVSGELVQLVQRTRDQWPAAWKSVPRLAEPTTWCSNPNIETHDGNGRTNCIGCHQYPNTRNVPRNREIRFSDTLSQGDSLSDYPQNGRAQYRENFPAEFAWSFSREFRPLIVAARRTAQFQWPGPTPAPPGRR